MEEQEAATRFYERAWEHERFRALLLSGRTDENCLRRVQCLTSSR